MQLNSLSTRLYIILKKNKIFLIYIPLGFYWILLFILTTIPTDSIPQFFEVQDKVEHFIAYYVLSILLLLTIHFQDTIKSLKKRAITVTLLLILFYGALDELHQMLVPGRIADITDWIADSIGGITGILTFMPFLNANKSNMEK